MTIALSFGLFLIVNGYSAETMPKPYLVLKIDGKTYKPNETVLVRKGEKIRIEAVLMGGRRAWCMYPTTYVHHVTNVHMNIVYNDENDLSFVIDNGKFRGEWYLKKEIANFRPGKGIKLKPLKENRIKRSAFKRRAEIEFLDVPIEKTFVKVNSKADWHYTANTPGGGKRKDRNSESSGSLLF